MSVTFDALITDYKSFKDDASEFGFAAYGLTKEDVDYYQGF